MSSTPLSSHISLKAKRKPLENVSSCRFICAPASMGNSTIKVTLYKFHLFALLYRTLALEWCFFNLLIKTADGFTVVQLHVVLYRPLVSLDSS